jgi:murein L,D-transpeptidase YcbB/YkuD
MSAAIAAAEPALPAYERLKGVLARYRDLAGGPWPPLPEPSPGTTQIVPGAAYAGAYALRERLVLLGDLSADAPPAPSPRYDATLVAAVKRFQARHGLVEDGIVGRETRRALDVPPATRVRQIELALERLRWLPPLRSGPVIAINVPSYRLWAFDAPLAPGAPALAMRVIVGRASAAMQTPIFASAMRSVEFSPYWNVPQSIVRNEILPKLRHDARYLAREDMEIVGNGTSASPPIDEATFARLASGELRIRQRPGPKNALGGIKFVLPNAMSIYLHGTPAQELFRSTRRDFSHGCIRVEDPLALAGFALRDRPEWTPERTREATTTGEPLTVPLPGPIAVLIFYTTAIVDGAGRALFLPDVYGYDARLDRALRARTATFATMAPMPVVR